MVNWRDRIGFDSCGKACFKGTNILVSVVLDKISEGLSRDGILQLFPSLIKQDIDAVLDYAAKMDEKIAKK